MIVGNILRPWLGFWPTTILLVLIMVAVLIPVGRAARQERKTLDGPPDPSTPRP
jgi:hypothetical protein